jgi:metal-responsive CopG/Arc/MetJ family transcriptional regulator
VCKILHTMKVRKNITLSKRVNEYLKLLAKEKKKSQSEIIEELIEKEIKEYKTKRKLEIFEQLLANISPYRGKIGNKTVQQIKKEIGDEV